jgi:hypothetical protein
MPAIQPERLKRQSQQVAALFNEPAAFREALHDLFEFYADRTRRPGQSGAPAPLLPAFNLPPPVLRHLRRRLEPLAVEDPAPTLALSDLLWADPHLECRLLAAWLLGRAAPLPPEPVLERLAAWAQPLRETQLITALVTAGSSRLRAEAPQAYQAQVAGWLKSSATAAQTVGLEALIPILQDQGFLNLPAVFAWITPLIHHAAIEVRPYLLDVIRILAERSPGETASHLRQALEIPGEATPGWLIRKTLALYPAEIQAGLRSALNPDL